MKKRTRKTHFMFREQGFMDGFISAFDIYGVDLPVVEPISAKQADLKALENDFEMVGQDLEEAMDFLDHE